MIKKIIIFTLLILFFSALPAKLQTTAAAAAQDEELLIILDYSASMNKKLNDKTRARYVLLALHSALANLPRETKIGLRVFGPDENYKSLMPGDKHTSHDCKASYLRAPIKSNNKTYISDRLSEYTYPFGQTPIEYSLREAINNDFSKSGCIKHIILISDGTDTCGGNPCKYIQQIMQNRKDIIIDTISIADSNGSYGDLSCLPRLTSGRYKIVKTENDIQLSFQSFIKTTSQNIKTVVKEPVFTSEDDDIKYNNYLFEIDY